MKMLARCLGVSGLLGIMCASAGAGERISFTLDGLGSYISDAQANDRAEWWNRAAPEDVRITDGMDEVHWRIEPSAGASYALTPRFGLGMTVSYLAMTRASAYFYNRWVEYEGERYYVSDFWESEIVTKALVLGPRAYLDVVRWDFGVLRLHSGIDLCRASLANTGHLRQTAAGLSGAYHYSKEADLSGWGFGASAGATLEVPLTRGIWGSFGVTGRHLEVKGITGQGEDSEGFDGKVYLAGGKTHDGIPYYSVLADEPDNKAGFDDGSVILSGFSLRAGIRLVL